MKSRVAYPEICVEQCGSDRYAVRVDAVEEEKTGAPLLHQVKKLLGETETRIRNHALCLDHFAGEEETIAAFVENVYEEMLPEADEETAVLPPRYNLGPGISDGAFTGIKRGVDKALREKELDAYTTPEAAVADPG